ncbi:MAG: 2Fe-2S iron-sulfur cluster-binding protein [Acidimicrobiales bacterium]
MTSGQIAETSVTITVDGQSVEAVEGETILEACNRAGIDTPTLCWAANLTPVNVCRVCVVEVEGSRTLVPSCSRTAEDGMVIQTDSERVRHSRRMVLEFLGSGVDLSQADDLARWSAHYGADPARYGADAERIEEPVRIQDSLYIRDYDKCVLCYKCVAACGDDAQHTFAIAVSGRGFDARISTEYDVELPNPPVCTAATASASPDRRHPVQERVRPSSGWRVACGRPDRHQHDLLVLRRRLHARTACAG